VNASGINIGKVGFPTAIAGTATVAGTLGVTGVLQALTTTVNNLQNNGVSAATNMFIGNTGGVASLFTNAARTATLNIQNASTSANIINIGSATSATNILGLRAATLDSITSSVLSVGSNVLTTGLNLNNKVLSGLTMGVNQFINLSTNTYNLGSGTNVVGSIGYINNLGVPNGAGFVDNAGLTTGVDQVYGNVTGVPVGVYLVCAVISISQVALTTFTSIGVTLTSTSSTSYIDRKSFTNGAASASFFSMSGVFACSAVSVMQCKIGCTFTGTAPKMSVDGFRFAITRLA
jgi:hypothetical protein